MDPGGQEGVDGQEAGRHRLHQARGLLPGDELAARQHLAQAFDDLVLVALLFGLDYHGRRHAAVGWLHGIESPVADEGLEVGLEVLGVEDALDPQQLSLAVQGEEDLIADLRALERGGVHLHALAARYLPPDDDRVGIRVGQVSARGHLLADIGGVALL